MTYCLTSQSIQYKRVINISKRVAEKNGHILASHKMSKDCITDDWQRNFYSLLGILGIILGLLDHSSANQPNYNHPYDGFALGPVPFHVSIQHIDDKGLRMHICSGNIISEWYVLSAAHCFRTISFDRLFVVVGSNRMNLTRDAIPQYKYTISKVIVHPLFQPLQGFDVALARVSPKFQFNGVSIGKINYANKNPTPANALGYLASWGHMQAGIVHDLRIVSFRTVTTAHCWKNGFAFTSKKDLCAYSYKENGNGACDGDSGSGLLNPHMNMLFGILSYGRRPCEPRRIYVFTTMWSVYDWVAANIKT